VTATAPAARQRILLTIGDPNGIGPEVAVKAARALAGTAEAPVLVGDRHVLTGVAGGLPLREFDPGTAPDPTAIDMVDVAALPAGQRRPGMVTAAAGAATVAYLQAALKLVHSGQGRAIVGCPHSETAINDAGITFSGYPSLLARLLGVPAGQLFLLLVGGGLRIAHVTLHERLAGALERLTPELIVAAASAAAAALPALGIESPRIGVFGINPHAGENGLFGGDDERIVQPAVAELRRRGLRVDGPAAADVLIRSPGYDAFVAMYHDQGHIPVKLLAGTASSALTIGAGVLFASVGHGAAFDIAGQDVADPAAVIGTIRLLGAASPPDSAGAGQ
jgi:4-hydroxy-L-threonine phosphate dehydrogenase PdxA